MTQVIQGFMFGKLTKDEFVGKLAEHNIQIDEKINSLIRNTESGSTPSFNEFGKVVLRKLSGLDAYNRVDKISLNNDRIVTPSKAGRTFGFVKPRITSETNDEILKGSQTRYLGDAYVPVRGGGLTKVNQLKSSINNALNMELAKQTGSNQEAKNQTKPVNNREFANSSGNFISWK